MGFIELIEDTEEFELSVGESTLNLRRFGTDVYNEIERKHTKTRKHRRTGQIIKDPDEQAVNRDLLDYMVISWRDVHSSTAEGDVPCTKENKNKLPGSVKLQILEACDSESITTEKKTISTSSEAL